MADDSPAMKRMLNWVLSVAEWPVGFDAVVKQDGSLTWLATSSDEYQRVITEPDETPVAAGLADKEQP